MDVLLIVAGLGMLGYGGYSMVVLPSTPLARGQSRRATQHWATGLLVAIAGTLALVLGIADSLLGGVLALIVAEAAVLAAGGYQWRRMLGRAGR